MIGKVIVGANFYETIRYCLEDKKDLSEVQKIEQSRLDQLQHKDRAEVLWYNKCFGDASELASQFLDVAKLNKRVEKPVFHFLLRLAPGDVLSRRQLIEMGEACVKEFGVADNQYVMILHKDSKEPHIHIVANRVSYDGKVAKDFQNYKKMDALCRRLEQRLQLKEVLSAKRYLPKELRNLPRHNTRFEKLKKDIQQTLEKVNTYRQFEEKMKSLGYVVLKGRGICFIYEKKVRIKGSEVGFSLSKIEKILAFKQKVAEKEELLNSKEKLQDVFASRQNQPSLSPAGRVLKQAKENERVQSNSVLREEIDTMKEIAKDVIYELLKPEHLDQSTPEFIRELMKRKRKRHRQSLHH